MPIQFDVRTLFFVGSAASLICCLMLWLLRGQHPASRDALRWSAGALGCFGAAMLLVSLRGSVPDWLSYVVANALGPFGAVLTYEGVRRLAGAPPMPRLVAGSAAALLALQAALGATADAHLERLLITSAVQGGFAAACIPLLAARTGREPAAPLRWAIAFCGLFALAHAARFAYTIAAGAPVTTDGMVAGTAGHAVMPALFALAPMGYAMILMGLVNGRIVQELWAIATIDTLTGVRTRRSFIDESRRALAAAASPRPVPRGSGARQDAPAEPQAVLMMLDLDAFKQINDQHGHAAGDRVLARFAELLRTMAPAGAVVGRYGGEEFCMLLPDTTVDRGIGFAQTICDRVRSISFGGGDPPLAVTVSIGLAGAPDGGSLEELLLAADRRLYLAKDWGRDRVVASDRPLPRGEAWYERPRTLVPV